MATRSRPSAPASSFSWLVVALVAIAVATCIRDPKALELAVRRVLLETNVAASSVKTQWAAMMRTNSDRRDAGQGVPRIVYRNDSERHVTGFKDGMHANSTVETTKEPGDFYTRVQATAAYFTPDGERLDRNISVLQNRIVFLFEGGQFIWPGIRIGHKSECLSELVKRQNDITLPWFLTFGGAVAALHAPLVFSVEDFLRNDEIDVILELSMPHLAPSGVTLQDGHENRPATDWRTSTTYWLDSSSHPAVQDIDKRTADLVKVPISHQESVQVLRYEPTQHYDQHLDYFSVERHRNSPDVLKRIEYGYKNRMITVFWYMSDVAKGGHTNFARSGGLPRPPHNKDCSQGISVAPKKRKVVVFYSMLPNGEEDPTSLHAGCPVEEGIKLSGNKWVWNKPRSDDD
ncbi:Prolyl 4-hydroxylase, alpha subunit [Phytophthora cactorum]|nr:Prolyl 4-hydroxylase, alpha subunit [Phytophthora cactorum]